MKKIITLAFLSVFVLAKPLPSDASITTKTLKNGFTYHIKENHIPKKTVNFSLLVRAGSMEEEPDQLGIAHLVEHMAFNGTKHFEKNSLIETLESIGVKFGRHLNASTSYDETIYILEFPAQKENLQKAMLVLRDWADGLLFNKYELEKEKGVVMQEANSRDDERFKMFLQSKTYLFANSRYLERTPIGDMKIVKNIGVDRVRAFYDNWYRPDLMDLVVVGDFDAQEMQKLIEKTFSSLKPKKKYKKQSKAIPQVNKTRVKKKTSKELTSNSLSIIYLEDAKPMTTQEQLRSLVVKRLASSIFGMISQKNRATTKDAYRMRFLASSFNPTKNAYYFYINVKDDKFLDALSNLNTTILRLEKYGFNAQDLESAKQNVLKGISHMYKRTKSLSSRTIASSITNALADGSVYLGAKKRFEIMTKIVKSITIDDVNKEFKRIVKIKNRIVEYTARDLKALPQKKKTIALLNKTPKNLKAFEGNKKLPKSLEVGKLKKAKVIAQNFDKKTLITTIDLDNGAKLVFRNTPFEKSMVHLSAISKGGFSQVKSKDLFALSVGVGVSNSSGTGKFNSYEISKILEGKLFSLKRGVGSFNEGISGSSALPDIEEMLKMLYLDFANPKVDDIALLNKKELLSQNLKNRDDVPKDKFARELKKFLYKDNYRKRSLSLKELNSLKKQDMLKLIKARFKDPNDFVFIFTGAIDLKKLKPLAIKYIGALPSKRSKKEKVIDDKIRPIKGKHTFTRNYSNGKNADVTMNFRKFKVDFSYQEQVDLSAMIGILNTRLREVIREEKSGVYGIYAHGGINKTPYKHSNIMIAFSCDPSRTKELISETKKVIKQLQKNPPKQSYLKNYKKMSKVRLDRALKSQSLWNASIISHYLYGTPYSLIVDKDSYLKKITTKTIQKTAQKYLRDDNLLITILNPKNKK